MCEWWWWWWLRLRWGQLGNGTVEEGELWKLLAMVVGWLLHTRWKWWRGAVCQFRYAYASAAVPGFH